MNSYSVSILLQTKLRNIYLFLFYFLFIPFHRITIPFFFLFQFVSQMHYNGEKNLSRRTTSRVFYERIISCINKIIPSKETNKKVDCSWNH